MVPTRERLLSDCFGNSDRESLQFSDIGGLDKLQSTGKLGRLLNYATATGDEGGFMTANNYDESAATDHHEIVSLIKNMRDNALGDPIPQGLFAKPNIATAADSSALMKGL